MKLASINLRKLVLSPTGSRNLGFILREELLLCSSYLPLGVPNWADIYTPSLTQHVINLYGETPLVNCGPQSILLHIYYRFLSTSIIYFLANKHLLPHNTFNPLLRLTTSLQVGDKYFGCVVCRFHVAAGAKATPQTGAINKFSQAIAKAS
jgi:hypothetical protein